MKKTPIEEAVVDTSEEMVLEYRFDYSKAKPNRFAAQGRVVVLDEDVARYFTTAEAVNKALRSLLEALPPGLKGETTH
jgi:hypothetical protein